MAEFLPPAVYDLACACGFTENRREASFCRDCGRAFPARGAFDFQQAAKYGLYALLFAAAVAGGMKWFEFRNEAQARYAAALSEAKRLEGDGDWPGAIAAYKQLLAEKPGDAETSAKLAEAEKGMAGEAARLASSAKDLLAKNDCGSAKAALDKAASFGGGKDASALLGAPMRECEQRKATLDKIEALLSEGRALQGSEQYAQAAGKFDEAASIGGGAAAQQLAAEARSQETARLAREAEKRKAEAKLAAQRRREAEAELRRTGVTWVDIPGGSFTMGYGADDGWSWAKPSHEVTVKSFQMAKTLVTFGQYRKCVAAGACTPAHVSDGTCYVYNGGKFGQGVLPASFQGSNQPAVCVDWDQAKAFSAWAGGRLPTEAEWEYAARSAGKDWQYPWGNETATCARAVINDGGTGCGRNMTWPVCSKPAGNTQQGLCDMAGNAWEWTQDWYHDSYNGAPTDGSAWENPTGSFRVLRGGSWHDGAGRARSAVRGYYVPGARSVDGGFRAAR